MKRLIPILFFFLATSLYGDPADDWSVEIIPSGITKEAKIIVADFNDPYFFVILTNKTDHILKVWKQWCSWGFFTLSFTVKQEDGNSFTLKRLNGAWTWNYPDATIVYPGKCFVLQATIAKKGSGVFEGFPPKFRDGKTTIQAHFTIKEDAETKKHGVWTGSVSSVPESIDIKKSLYD